MYTPNYAFFGFQILTEDIQCSPKKAFSACFYPPPIFLINYGKISAISHFLDEAKLCWRAQPNCIARQNGC